jgi:hypothetical protein
MEDWGPHERLGDQMCSLYLLTYLYRHVSISSKSDKIIIPLVSTEHWDGNINSDIPISSSRTATWYSVMSAILTTFIFDFHSVSEKSTNKCYVSYIWDLWRFFLMLSSNKKENYILHHLKNILNLLSTNPTGG